MLAIDYWLGIKEEECGSLTDFERKCTSPNALSILLPIDPPRFSNLLQAPGCSPTPESVWAVMVRGGGSICLVSTIAESTAKQNNAATYNGAALSSSISALPSRCLVTCWGT